MPVVETVQLPTRRQMQQYFFKGIRSVSLQVPRKSDCRPNARCCQRERQAVLEAATLLALAFADEGLEASRDQDRSVGSVLGD